MLYSCAAICYVSRKQVIFAKY